MKGFLYSVISLLIVFIVAPTTRADFSDYTKQVPDGPWFNTPIDVVVDSGGNFYVSNSTISRIQKYDASGNLLLNWGTNGINDGQLISPNGLAVDSYDNIYVIEGTGGNRVQKFSSTGEFITKWGSLGSASGQFDRAVGIAVDSQDNVYVSDTTNHRIQKFDSVGNFILSWGEFGSGDGQFDDPQEIAIDADDFIYVADRDNKRVQKFDINGSYKTEWGSSGTGDGQFTSPLGIAVAAGKVFVGDFLNIQSFTATGTFLGKWGSLSGWQTSQFNFVKGLGSDSEGNIYVVDSNNGRIQKFSHNLVFVEQFGGKSSQIGEFALPIGIAIDSNGSIFVSDSDKHNVQKFSSSTEFIFSWGSQGSGVGQFNNPQGVATDSAGNIYVVDNGNRRIQKFNPDGSFAVQWGALGSNNGQFNNPFGIAIDAQDNVYVVDTGNKRVQKFDSDGIFITKWGISGIGDGQFNTPYGIAIDSRNPDDVFVYVTDSGATANRRVQKFTSSGVYISKFGSSGYSNGQFNTPKGIAIDSNGNIFVADSGTVANHIQKFTSSGIFVSKISQISSAARLLSPSLIALDANDNLYVVDTNHFRLQIFYNNPPSPSSNLNLISATKDSLSFSWDGSGLNHYLVQTTTSSRNSGWTDYNYHTFNNLECGQVYPFVVKSRNGLGVETAWSETLSFIPPCPLVAAPIMGKSTISTKIDFENFSMVSGSVSLSEPGGSVRLSTSTAITSGIYYSPLFFVSEDANWQGVKTVASVPTGTDVSIFARSGNSDYFDESWSTWQPVVSGIINVPIARYLQLAIDLTSFDYQSPEIFSFTVFSGSSSSSLLTPSIQVSSSSPQIVIFEELFTEAAVVNIPDTVPNPTLNLLALAQSSEESTAVTIPQEISINATTTLGQVRVSIPAGITITAPTSTWDAIIDLPQARDTASINLTNSTVLSAIKIGDSDVGLTFDKAIKLVFSGYAGKRIGYYDSVNAFHAITETCTENSQDWTDANLSEAGDCKIDDDDDLVVWTKHFTEFVVYEDTPPTVNEPRTIASAPPAPACAAITYSDWQPCQTGFNLQFRTITSQSPESCSLTVLQRQLMERSCSGEPATESDSENGTSSEDSAALKDFVLSRERTLTTKINTALSSRLSGRILLQVEEKGEAWYLNPLNNLRYYLGRPADAFNLMRALGLGATTQDISSFLKNTAPKRLSGRILLQVEDKGQAYYVNPLTLKLHYLGRPDDAFNLMRTLGLGISNSNVRQIGLGE